MYNRRLMAEEVTKTGAPVAALTVAEKLRLLLEITRKISRSLNLEEVLAQVMDTLDSLITYDAAGIYIIRRDPHATDGGSSSLIFHAEAVRGYDIEEMMELRLKLGEGLIGWVAQKGEATVVPDVRADPRYVNARRATRSEVVAPIISNDEVIGVFDLESDELNAYSSDDLEVLMLLASQVAIIIEKVMLHEQLIEKKRLQGQLEVARQVQLELLPPQDPELPGYDISAYNFPTEEVSGDYYDWVRIYDDEIGIVIADVSGKGVPAAILMAFLRSSLRAATHIGYATNISLSKVNYLLWESIERNQFVTAFHAILDASNRTLSYSNAGHNPPLLINAKGETSFIEYGEQPLGMFPETRYHQYHLLLEPGDVLVLYTDGVTEASNPDDVEFGRDRLVQAVKDNYERPARELIASLEMAVLEWTANRGANDDVTFFVIKALQNRAR